MLNLRGVAVLDLKRQWISLLGTYNEGGRVPEIRGKNSAYPSPMILPAELSRYEIQRS